MLMRATTAAQRGARQQRRVEQRSAVGCDGRRTRTIRVTCTHRTRRKSAVGEEEEEEAQQDGKKTITTRGTYGKSVITITTRCIYG